VGTNFASTSDFLSDDQGTDTLLVTGHRGFNNEGAEVKLWDLRHFGDAENFHQWSYLEHRFSPEVVRFAGDRLIVSASKDREMHLINLEGKQVDSLRHSCSYTSIAVL
jgi:hypothetical protein